jgi:hypothetical protein
LLAPRLVRTFKALWYDGPFPGGRYQFMTGPRGTVRLPNPHRGDISVDLLKRILRVAGISDEELNQA